MPIDWSLFEIGKGTPAKLAKGWKKAAREAKLEDAYKEVDKRDGTICRVTGRELRKGLPGAVPPRIWHTRHHMFGRRGDRLFDVSAIFVCCWEAHEALEHNLIEIEGTDAYKRLFFHWNRRMVPPGKEPFRIVTADRSSRRAANLERSQNDE